MGPQEETRSPMPSPERPLGCCGYNKIGVSEGHACLRLISDFRDFVVSEI